MTHHQFKPSGVCSTLIEFDLDDQNRIHNTRFTLGCYGNLKAISKLTEGMEAEKAISILKGNQCKNKGTSCADQYTKALEAALSGNA